MILHDMAKASEFANQPKIITEIITTILLHLVL